VSHDQTKILPTAGLDAIPSRPAAVARAMAAVTAARRLAFPAARLPGGAADPGVGATVVLHSRKHFALTGSMLAMGAVGAGVLAFVALRRPEPAPAALTADSTMPGDVALTAAPEGVALAERQPETQPAPRQAPEPAKLQTPMALPKAEGTAGAALTNSVDGRFSNAAPAIEMPPMAFDAKTLVGQGPKQRERDAQILLADGKVTVTAGNKDILHSVPYSGVMAVSYSRGRDPLWNSPQGPAPVAKMGGGAFGFMRGERHWIALRTTDSFVVLRLQDDQIRQALGALQERTGRVPERVIGRKDSR